jgi:hypothetical protein
MVVMMSYTSYNINIIFEMFGIKTVTKTFDSVCCTHSVDPYF